MQLISALFPPREASPPATPSGRLHDAARALLFALVAAAIWGLAVGAQVPAQALANVYRVPLVILLSAVATLPAGVLLWRALDVSADLSELVSAYAKATFHGALALAAFAPLLAIYSLTSAPGLVSALSVLSACVALAVAGFGFLRSLARSVPREHLFRAVPVALVCVAIQLAALPQLISVMSPILPSPTTLAGGVEGLFGAR
jgi:hypothetical protein